MKLLEIANTKGIALPDSFVWFVVEGRMHEYGSWFFLCKDDDQFGRLEGHLAKLMPDEQLVPFAQDLGSDVVACFRSPTEGVASTVVNVDQEPPDAVIVEEFASFGHWLLTSLRRNLELFDDNTAG